MADGQTIITVRGAAQRTVDPDRGTLHGRIEARGSNRADALRSLAGRQRELTDALAAVGGIAHTAGTDREAVTWTAGSVHTYQEHPQSALARRGRFVASLSLTVRVREFELLDRVAGIVTGTADVSVDYVSWELDDDSPAEREVRADAVRAALQRGRDYAAAVGATISAVEHLADVGLLHGGHDVGWVPAMAGSAGGEMARGTGGGEEPELALDPQPQHVLAQVEARLVATGVDLSAGS